MQYIFIGSDTEYYILSESTYTCPRQDFQLPRISTITKMTPKVKTVVQSFLVHQFSNEYFWLCVILVLSVILTQTFSSIIFVNRIPHVYIVDQKLEPSDIYCKFYNLELFLMDFKMSSFFKRYIFPSEADLQKQSPRGVM